MHPMLNVAVKAARRAGRIINRASLDLDTVQVTRKQRNDFVTEVDHASEQAIIDTLLTAYPDHAILAEESGHSPGAKSATKDDKSPEAPGPAAASDPRVAAKAPSRANASRRAAPAFDGEALAKAEHIWIIDPLDGTTNFIHGLPQYAVSIGLMQKGQMTQAVVYDPTRDELFTASKGRGAFLNDRRIRVSKRTKLDEALIGTGFPFRRLDSLDDYLRMFRSVTEKVAAVRRPGAAALDLAYVACGRYDGFFEFGLSPWDVAAGSLLITEGGGLIGDFGGEAGHVFAEEVVAGTPKVFSAMLSLLKSPAAPRED